MSEEKGEKMTKSTFIVNGKTLEIKTINYNRGNLDIITTNNYLLNIDFNFDITELKEGSRENILGKIYKDQNFSTDKYSYVIYIGQDVYLTKNKNKYFIPYYIHKIEENKGGRHMFFDRCFCPLLKTGTISYIIKGRMNKKGLYRRRSRWL